MNAYKTLWTEVVGQVATIWLNRPERRNAVNMAMLHEIHQAFAVLEADDDVRAIVVTGTGSAFSSGTDLSGGPTSLASSSPGVAGSNRGVEVSDAGEGGPRTAWIKPWKMRTPIIAAMNGTAIGIGLTLPMTWDVRVAAEDATYSFVFNRRGVLPEWGSLWLVPRLVGMGRCLDLLLSGRRFTGVEALSRGLVTAAVPAAEVLPTALEIAHDIAAANPLSVGLTKALAYDFLDQGGREPAYERELEAFLWLASGQDAVEGVAAHLEKRDPQWSHPKSAPFEIW